MAWRGHSRQVHASRNATYCCHRGPEARSAAFFSTGNSNALRISGSPSGPLGWLICIKYALSTQISKHLSQARNATTLLHDTKRPLLFPGSLPAQFGLFIFHPHCCNRCLRREGLLTRMSLLWRSGSRCAIVTAAPPNLRISACAGVTGGNSMQGLCLGSKPLQRSFE